MFICLFGNCIGSYIKGKKSEVYGGIEEFDVICLVFVDLIMIFDFVKMDIEGVEVDVICFILVVYW